MADTKGEPSKTAPTQVERPMRCSRQEAHRMTYNQLFEPEQSAVRDLLEGLISARSTTVGRDDRTDSGVAPTFFLSGARGAGKTTVLMNTRYAVENSAAFFADAPILFHNEQLKELSRTTTWLQPLDMEFFQGCGNLLTTLLVRIRNALVSPSRASGTAGTGAVSARHRSLPAQLVEEGDDAWTQIDELVKNATVMWQAIPDLSAARRAELEISAAETNADFQSRFRSAVAAVCRQVARNKYGGEQQALILSIDNADRSADHVFQIVRLIRMVACPMVWYVLAGSDRDLDTFLEKSYQDQLRVGRDADGAEQILAIARRQAASDARAVLPPASRITIDPVSAKQALGFSGDGDSHATLASALEKLRLPRAGDDGAAGSNGGRPDNLFQLLTLDWVERTGLDGTQPPAKQPQATPDTIPDVMSQAGEGALKVPARTVVDIYQLARLWLDRQENRAKVPGDDEAWGTLGFVYDVLKNAICESELPMWASQLLDDVIGQDGQGRIALDLRGEPFSWHSRVRLRETLDLRGDYVHRHKVRGEAEEFARLTEVKVGLYDYHGVAVSLGQGALSVELPGPVSGWLRVLYDVLRQLETPRIIEHCGPHPKRERPLLVQTAIATPIWKTEPGGTEIATVDFAWRAPDFDSFFDHDLFARRWARARKDAGWSSGGLPSDSCAACRRLLAGWIDVAESVSDRKTAEWTPLSPAALTSELPNRLDACYQDVAKENAGGRQQLERGRAIREWLEIGLPLLFRPEFVWMGECEQTTWNPTASPFLSLKKAWVDNDSKIFAERYRVFVDALKREPLYQHYEARMSTPQGLPYPTLHGWLLEACDFWFRNVFEVEKAINSKGEVPWYPKGSVAAPDSLGRFTPLTHAAVAGRH